MREHSGPTLIVLGADGIPYHLAILTRRTEVSAARGLR